MKELCPLAELTERADAKLLRQLVHCLADKDPVVRRECLGFLKQGIALPAQATAQVDAEEIWTLWEEQVSDLSDLDEYGGGSDETEDHVCECLSSIETLLKEREISREERMALIEEVLPFIRSNNAGMEDFLYDIVYAACKDNEDWRNLAEAFENIGRDWPLDQARRIYRKIGDDEKYLQLRAMKMEFGLDYYDLITFYLERGDRNRAIAVAQEGLVKATGRMDELHEFMAEHFSEQGNRAESLRFRFIQMVNGLSAHSYEQFKNECSAAEWHEYEPQIIKALEKTGLLVQLKIRMLRQEYEKALVLLQKIEFSIFSWEDHSVLEAAAALETKFPEQILEFYRRRLGSYDVCADRKIYARLARVALKIRHMFLDVMNQPEKWKNMLQDMRFKNLKRKAFFEEFSKILPDW